MVILLGCASLCSFDCLSYNLCEWGGREEGQWAGRQDDGGYEYDGYRQKFSTDADASSQIQLELMLSLAKQNNIL